MYDLNKSVIDITTILGEPQRYAYRAKPATFYVHNADGVLEKQNGYSVDFEIACDIFDLNEAKSDNCVYNPHLINILEPGVDIDDAKPYISHSIILDVDHYVRLQSVTNRDGGLMRYTGVVNGYSVDHIKSVFKRNDVLNTGVCLSKGIYLLNGLQRPEIPFDEKKHARYVQLSESYKLKLQRNNNSLVLRDLYEPTIHTLEHDNLYAFC